MKKIVVITVSALLVLGVLWWVGRMGFGINIPLIGKDTPTQELLNRRLQMPAGLSLSVFASDLNGARDLVVTDSGDVLVSLPREGQVMLLKRDGDDDGGSDGRKVLLSGLNLPHGIALYKNWLYVAETDAVGRIRFDADSRQTLGDYRRIVSGLPKGGSHWSRSLRFGPDGKLYVSIGSSCNVCEENDPRRAAIMRFTPEGEQGEIFASGLRNTVGFAWRPSTGELYGVDNGRDFLGDDFPPCELNLIERGQFYGWPYVNGNQVPDPDYGDKNPEKASRSVPPVHEFGAHTAPLSIVFIDDDKLRSLMQGSALVAMHGSWNRSVKTGYKLVALQFDAEQGIVERDFITGFELHDDVIGRPVAIAEAADGSLYISDDFIGSIYRISDSGE